MKVIMNNQVVDVKDGYARNYLLPRGLAVLATEENIAVVQKKQKAQVAEKTEKDEAKKKIAGSIDGKKIRFLKEVGEKEKLFGSVTKDDIAKRLKVEKIHVQLSSPLKELGTHEVKLKFGNQTATVSVIIAGKRK